MKAKSSKIIKASSYKLKGKAPYQYRFRNCEHRTTVMQSTPTWTGRVCTICNTVVPRRERD